MRKDDRYARETAAAMIEYYDQEILYAERMVKKYDDILRNLAVSLALAIVSSIMAMILAMQLL